LQQAQREPSWQPGRLGQQGLPEQRWELQGPRMPITAWKQPLTNSVRKTGVLFAFQFLLLILVNKNGLTDF
jgi:hypothetical protein